MSEDHSKYVHLAGPAVDAIDARKEAGVMIAPTEQEMRSNYERVKVGLFNGLKRLAESVRLTSADL